MAAIALLLGAQLAAAQDIRIAYTNGSPADSAVAAFVRMVNDEGGVGGRKLVLAARDDAAAAVVFDPLGVAPRPRTEARILAHYIIDAIEAPKIVILYPNDAVGRAYLEGLRAGLGDGADRLVLRATGYDPAQPMVEPQVAQLRGAGANVFADFAAPKFAAQAARKAAELGWKPVHIVASASVAAGSLTDGVVAAHYMKAPSDPQWRDDPDIQAWRAWMQKYLPGDANEPLTVQAYVAGHVLIARLKGGAANVRVPMLLPGITVHADDPEPITQMQMMGLSGGRWQPFGPVLAPGLPPSAARSPGTAGAR